MAAYKYKRIDLPNKVTMGAYKLQLLSSLVILQFIVMLLLYFNKDQAGPQLPNGPHFPTYTMCYQQPIAGNGTPTFDYEVLRRQIATNIREMSSFAKSAGKMSEEAQNILRGQTNSLLSAMDKMRQSDGHDEWRMAETKALSEIIQNRIKRLQNPQDCSRARKVACKLDSTCGFGCKVHQLVICLLISHATNRTMVLQSQAKIYGDSSWDSFLLPFSATCTDANGKTHGNWANHFVNPLDPVQVLHVPITSDIQPKPDYLLSRSLPGDLSRRLIGVHGDPGAWWIGQFLQYILRFQPATQAMLDQRMEEIKVPSTPIVGVHIRRTDKLKYEAKYHDLAEYMAEVEDFFDRLDIRDPGPKVKRRVYIASDDPSVLQEVKEKYPSYEVLGDKEVVQTASVDHRYSSAGLSGIILDTYILSRCDFIVCTFSSNVCRLAYEMQIAHQKLWSGPAIVSVDSQYSLVEPNRVYRQALMTHIASGDNESGLEIGDVVKDSSDYSVRSKGLIYGFNEFTEKWGTFPAYKLGEYASVGGFPHYSDDD